MWINRLINRPAAPPPSPAQAPLAPRNPAAQTSVPKPAPAPFPSGPAPGLQAPPAAHLKPEAKAPQAPARRIHDAESYPLPDPPDRALVKQPKLGSGTDGRPAPTADEKHEALLQKSYNTLPPPPALGAPDADARLKYGSVKRDPGPELQSETRLAPRRDSISTGHNIRLQKGMDADRIGMQMHPDGTVPMKPHVKAAFELFREQRKAFDTDPAYAQYSNRHQRELGNHFGFDPNDPKRVRAYGTGPGPGGAFIGVPSGDAVYIPPPRDPNILISMHDHNKGKDNFFSPEDLTLASLNRTQHGVPTEAMVHRPPGLPRGQGEQNFLTNGRIETTGPDGKPTLLDRPAQYQAVPNKDAFIGPPSNDLRSIPFADLRPKPKDGGEGS